MGKDESRPKWNLAYVGDQFVIEWYVDLRGESDPLDYFEELKEGDQNKAMFLFQRMGESGKILDKTKFRNEGDGIFAFKPQPHRFLCFFMSGRRIVVTNAFWKKGDKLPKAEKQRALDRRAEYNQMTTDELNRRINDEHSGQKEKKRS